MAEARTIRQHQFDDMEHQKDASTLGMWVFLLTEALFFGGLFTAYIVYRVKFPQAWTIGSHELDVRLGAINTAVLIFSSLTMALAVNAAQVGRRRMLVFFLVATLVLGSVFLGIKGVEYGHKLHEGHFPGPAFHFDSPYEKAIEIFFSLYFAMTGMHALHMVIGAGLLVYLIRQSIAGRFGPEYYTPVDVIGLYWHFVDIIWIFLFPLLYLLGRH